MTALFLKHSGKKPGSAPGTISLVGEQRLQKVRLREISYSQDAVEEKEFASIDECLAYKSKGKVRWINIDGLHDANVMKRIGDAFDIHPLVLEDIVNLNQRPKAENHDDYLYVTLKMFHMAENGSDVIAEQMSFILKDNLVLSFQERVGDFFEEVRNRIRTGRTGWIRARGADYLLYALIDAIVDHYFIVLEKLGDRIELTEDDLGRSPTQETLESVYGLRREVVRLRKSVWPLRELLSVLLKKDNNDLFDRKTDMFLADVHDHVIEALDILEGNRELLAGMLELYQSRVGNRMNEVMKVLTVIATIFIPPTFVAGIYGMNFENMPELHSRDGYFVVLGIMVGCIGGMLLYFRKKKWL